MIAAVRGKLEWMGPDSLLIDISGVSLRLFVPAAILNDLGPIGGDIKLYTHLYVREDQLTLYGFKNNILYSYQLKSLTIKEYKLPEFFGKYSSIKAMNGEVYLLNEKGIDIYKIK